MAVVRPQATDAASAAHIDFLIYSEYLDRLDHIYSTFSKAAILKGSFDRYAQSTAKKRGTSEVDAEFLREIEGRPRAAPPLPLPWP